MTMTAIDVGAQTLGTIRAMSDAVTIESPHSFTVGTSLITVPAGSDAITSATYRQLPQSPLIRRLAQTLYHRFYCSITVDEKADAIGAPHSEREFEAGVQRLSRANAAVDKWDVGWSLYSMLSNGQIIARKGDEYRALWGGQYVCAGSIGQPPTVGTEIEIRQARESLSAQPGVYFAVGSPITDSQDDRDLVRLYWSVTYAGAPRLLAAITHRLAYFAVPFRYKTQVYPKAYDRTDSAVLFITRRHFAIVSELIQEIHEQLRDELRNRVPPFTKWLAKGLALAEDPGTDDSFGMDRCKLVAEGLRRGYERSATTIDQKVDAIVEVFGERGLSLDMPYLNKGSRDLYEFTPKGPGRELLS